MLYIMSILFNVLWVHDTEHIKVKILSAGSVASLGCFSPSWRVLGSIMWDKNVLGWVYHDMGLKIFQKFQYSKNVY